jgi:hypothetical protein
MQVLWADSTINYSLNDVKSISSMLSKKKSNKKPSLWDIFYAGEWYWPFILEDAYKSMHVNGLDSLEERMQTQYAQAFFSLSAGKGITTFSSGDSDESDMEDALRSASTVVSTQCHVSQVLR